MLTIVPLSGSHDRMTFDCGVDALNSYLQKTARQHREKGLSNTFVMIDETAPTRVMGYFTLSFLEVDVTSIPHEQAKHLPRRSRVPAAKLARLAVDKRFQGQGLGDLLVADAIKRILRSVREAGNITGLFVDAMDERAVNFYARLGFQPLQDSPLKLFIPLKRLMAWMD